MQILEYVWLALRSISHRKLRSWLTVIGIIIGIAAITSLLTLSQSLSQSIEEQFESFGTNMIFITPKNMMSSMNFGGEIITEKDVSTLQSMPEIEEIIPTRVTSAKIEFHDNEAYVTAASFELSNPDLLKKMGLELIDGHWIEKGDSRSVVLGHLVAHEIFDEDIHVKNRVYLNGEKYVVVGILEEIGSSQDDMQVYVSDDDLIEISGKDEIAAISALVRSGLDVETVADKAELKIKRARNDDDLIVMTSADILEQVNSILGIINFVLVGVAAISLLVGSIGIMNTMYTAVLERTKEIGIMKAIGAGRKDIMMIFLIESAIFGLLGGAIGAFLGTLLAKSMEVFSSSFPFHFNVYINPTIIITSILFAAIVGAASGALPAYKAAKLKPTDALKYE